MVLKTVHTQIANGLIDGAVVLAGNKEKDLLYEAFGVADHENHFPMQKNTIFDIASLTKVFGTNAILLKAIEAGLVDLDRPFTEFLNDFSGKINGKVTIRDLATHTSGVNASYCHHGSPSEMRKGILNVDFLLPPQQNYQYTCTNLILIGLLLEQVYGQNLDILGKRLIFDPLKMRETRWVLPPEGCLDRTIRTINADPGIISDFGAKAYFPCPLGNAGIFSTAEDLARYIRALFSGFYPKRITKLCFENISPARVGHPHAIGWNMAPEMVPSGFSKTTVHHSGWTGQSVWIDPQKECFIIVLTNRMGDWAMAKEGRKMIAEDILSQINME